MKVTHVQRLLLFTESNSGRNPVENLTILSLDFVTNICSSSDEPQFQDNRVMKVGRAGDDRRVFPVAVTKVEPYFLVPFLIGMV